MSKLKLADLSSSPFGFCEKGNVFEDNASGKQCRILSVESGIVYWEFLDEKDRVSLEKLKGSCRLS